MKTTDRAAVVIIHDQQLLLIERHRTGQAVYYVLPGGGVEPGETPAQAAVREVKEELGVAAEITGPLPGMPLELDRHHWIFRAHITSRAKPAWQEARKQKPGNKYYAVWVDLADLPDKELRPAEAAAILRAL